MDDLFSYGPKTIQEFFKKNFIAILYTIIVHLMVLIILVLVKVDGLKHDQELGVMLDFEEEVKLEELIDEKIEVPPEWIEKVIEARQQASNRAVNMNDEVNREISTEDYVNELLNELESQKDEEFLKNREKWKEILSEKVQEEEKLVEIEEETPFTGPTTITYNFIEAPKNRQKRKLVIPVYRCEGSALVIVDCVVRKDGSVSDVKVVKAESGSEPSCFIEAAEAAALQSSFKSAYSAPEKHKVRITYQFVAQ